MHVVLVCGPGRAWEPPAVSRLERDPATAVLRRCVDVEDLMAAATSGQAQVALVAADLPGLDAAAVAWLAQHGLAALAVVEGDAPSRALGVSRLVPAAELDDVVGLVAGAVAAGPPRTASAAAPTSPGVATAAGRVVAVWGPAGAPGRSTLTVALGGVLARRGDPALLLDADPYGGSIAQQLGVTEEVSGLLAAARLADGAHLAERFTALTRRLDDQLSLLTGLPRVDRWPEVSASAVEGIVAAGRRGRHVLIDTGFCLEEDAAADFAAGPGRNDLTLGALAAADAIVVVGRADPIGLTRLVRGVAALGEGVAGAPLHVVLNRMRPSLGWSEAQVREVLTRTGMRATSLHVVPDDVVEVDRAVAAGRIPGAGREGAFSRAVAEVADAVFGSAPPRSRAGRQRARTTARTAGTARPR